MARFIISRVIKVTFTVFVLVIVAFTAKNNPKSIWLSILSGAVAIAAFEYIGIIRDKRAASDMFDQAFSKDFDINLSESQIPDTPIGQGVGYIKKLLCKKGVPSDYASELAYQIEESYGHAEWADASYADLKDGLYIVFAVRQGDEGMDFADFYSFLKDGKWENHFLDNKGQEIPGFVPLIVNSSSYVDEERGRSTLDLLDRLRLFDDDDQ